MSKTIYKYKLDITDTQILSIPGHECFLKPTVQNGELFIYSIANPGHCETQQEILICGTGNPIPDDITCNYIYIDTVQIGFAVWHIFYNYQYA